MISLDVTKLEINNSSLVEQEGRSEAAKKCYCLLIVIMRSDDSLLSISLFFVQKD
jgi:hypothetical protein